MPEHVAAASEWLPVGFTPPPRVELSTGHHLRSVGPADVDRLMSAVTASQPRLWAIYGDAWGWPAAELTREQHHQDLVRHAAEAAALEAFTYALFDSRESQVLGCVYIDPPQYAHTDAEVSWWVVTAQAGTGLEIALDALVPCWLADHWPFAAANFPHNSSSDGA